MKAIICLGGGIASGKTTVAQALADAWRNSSVRSFGDVVRARVRAEGLVADRAILQEMGIRLIMEGWSAFVDALLTDLSPQVELLILDGVRHVEAVCELRRRFPMVPVRLVFLATHESIMQQRMVQRGEPCDAFGHTIESELKNVAEAADILIESGVSLADIVGKIRVLVGN